MTDAEGFRENPRYAVVGASHQTADAAFRDRLFVDDDARTGLLESLQQGGISQAVILSTCDRVEFHLAVTDPEQGVRVVEEVVADRTGRRRAVVALSGPVDCGDCDHGRPRAAHAPRLRSHRRPSRSVGAFASAGRGNRKLGN